MGWILVDQSNGKILSWTRNDIPRPAPGQVAFELVNPPDRDNSVWDGGTGVRPKTAAELQADAAAVASTVKEQAKASLTSQDMQTRINRALIKVIAQLTNKTPSQVKTALVMAIDNETDPNI